MNCHDFEENVTELAKGRLRSSQHRAGLAHASACRKCGAVLEAERLLTAELRVLAATQDAEEAPPGIEQQLLASFRLHSARRTGPTMIAGDFALPAARRILNRLTQGWSWRLWGTVTACLALGILVFYGLLRHSEVDPVKSTPELQSMVPTNSMQQARRPETPTVAAVQARNAVPERITATQRAPSRRPKARPPAARAQDQRATIEAEALTDFYAIPYVEPAFPGETMRIVRTRVPRSSLAAFGFPVDGERAFDPIQADVLVGEDNVARAIRFVQRWQLPQSVPRPAGPAQADVKYVR